VKHLQYPQEGHPERGSQFLHRINPVPAGVGEAPEALEQGEQALVAPGRVVDQFGEQVVVEAGVPA
jgi:hypothetical protein